MNNVNEFLKKKESRELISMVTAYDYPTAVAISESSVDAILVGDSVAMVTHGHPHTTHATIDMMCLHTQAVFRGAKSKFIVTDIPFLVAHRSGDALLEALDLIVKSGAQAVKIEGGEEVFHSIERCIRAGVPVIGHLGLTPQSVNSLGGYKVQGRDDSKAKTILKDALELEKRGVFAIVLECVPEELAAQIQNQLRIPIIGIGAGANVDGQILVIDDLLGRTDSHKPRFTRQYANFFEDTVNALNHYHQDILVREFPNIKESFK